MGGIEYCITGMIIHSYTVIITNTASIKTVKATVVLTVLIEVVLV